MLERTGRFGGGGGTSFESPWDASWGRITQILVRSGHRIDSLGFVYNNGTTVQHGGTGGSAHVEHLASDEYITGVEGRAGSKVDQLKFHTNKRVLGPYGGGGGDPFNFHGNDADELKYIFGRSGSELDQIGFVFGERSPPPSPGEPQEEYDHVFRSDSHGGNGGDYFNDLGLDVGPTNLGRIERITIRHGARVDFLQAHYAGQVEEDAKKMAHGGGGGTLSTFDLGEHEFITEIRGRAGSRVDQLEFVTNTGRHSEVYGGGGGSPFTLSKMGTARVFQENDQGDYVLTEEPAAMAVKAFYGRSGRGLDQLGAYFVNETEIVESMTLLTFEYVEPDTTAVEPIVVARSTLTNNSAGTNTITKSIGETRTNTLTWSVTKSYEQSITITIGFKKGTEGIASKSIEVALGLTFGQEYTNGEESSTSVDLHTTASQTLGPYSSATCSLIASQSAFDLHWHGDAVVTYRSGLQRKERVGGTLEGVRLFDSRIQFDDIVDVQWLAAVGAAANPTNLVEASADNTGVYVVARASDSTQVPRFGRGMLQQPIEAHFVTRTDPETVEQVDSFQVLQVPGNATWQNATDFMGAEKEPDVARAVALSHNEHVVIALATHEGSPYVGTVNTSDLAAGSLDGTFAVLSSGGMWEPMTLEAASILAL